jgi:hypothetical protein
MIILTTTDPTLFIHSARDPSSYGTDWISLAHDQTQGVIATGVGDLDLSPTADVHLVAASMYVDDQESIYFGTSAQSEFQFDTTQTNNSLMLGLDATSRNFIICDIGDINTDFARAASSNPTLFIQSNDVASATEYLALYHDATDARVMAGTGKLVLGIVDSGDVIEVEQVIHGDDSKWYAQQYLPVTGMVAATSGGGNAPTWTAPDLVAGPYTTLGGWNFDNDDTSQLIFQFKMGSDWDAASDIEVLVDFEANEAGAGANTTDLELQTLHKKSGDTAPVSQSLTDSVTVGACAQYDMFQASFTVDYDDGSNPVDASDTITAVLTMDAAASEVDNIIVNFVTIRYKTAKMNPEV